MTGDPRSHAWQRLEALWEAVSALPETERQQFLDTLGAEDAALRSELEALIAGFRPAEAFFRRFASIVEAGADEVVGESRLAELRAGLAGRYAIEHELGRGGMATVYLARDLRHDRPVALKVLEPELAATLGVDRFLREIEIAANLRHPHILPVYDSGEASTFLYYVMPYEPGHSLRERLAREGALPVDDTVRILHDVVDALAHAHEHGIVHRDIKAENVLLSARHAVVADFGVAKALVAATRGLSDTDTGIAIGTPRCMAPEQAAGDADVDHRADIYAVGVLAYEMLAGRPPFVGATARELLWAHLSQDPEPLAAIRPGVPPALTELVMKCLAKKPADRWQRADEMLARLDPSRTHALEAHTAARRPAVTPPERRPRVVRWSLAGAAIAAVALLSWALRRVPSPRVETTAAPSIAVLPLVSLGDVDDAALADGITVELISELARAGLRPVASTSAFAFRDRHADVRTIADSLHVPYILEGVLQEIASHLRVHVALIDARDRSTLWSRSYDRELRDVFAIQGDIALAVASEVGVRLGAASPPGRAIPTADPAAYELYLLGSDDRVFRSDSASRQALEYLREAVALDSTFAGAWARLALMHVRVAPREDPDMPIHDRVDLAERFARRAVAMDSSLAEAQEVLGFVLMWRYHFEEAESRLRRAIELDPSHPEPREYLVRLYTWTRRFEDALDQAKAALELDPLSPAAHAELARAWLVNGRCDEALKQLERIADLDPPVGRARLVAAECYALEGNWAEAIAQVESPRARTGMSMLGYLYARAGHPDRALVVLAELGRTPGAGAFDGAVVYAGLRDFDQAFIWLERSIDDHSLDWRIMEPMFADLRDDPRFSSLLERMGLQKR